MSEEVLSIAFVRPLEGQEAEVLAVARALYALLERKQYSRDLLYRDTRDPHLLVNLRYWRSPEAANWRTKTLTCTASGRAWGRSAAWRRCTNGWKKSDFRGRGLSYVVADPARKLANKCPDFSNLPALD